MILSKTAASSATHSTSRGHVHTHVGGVTCCSRDAVQSGKSGYTNFKSWMYVCTPCYSYSEAWTHQARLWRTSLAASATAYWLQTIDNFDDPVTQRVRFREFWALDLSLFLIYTDLQLSNMRRKESLHWYCRHLCLETLQFWLVTVPSVQFCCTQNTQTINCAYSMY